MQLTAAQIADLIPHSGTMCLLDGVVRWDAKRIVCLSRSHHAADNPMRAAGKLTALCGIEYAMQAMAVHGGLVGNIDGRPRAGYLASLRDVACRSDRLDLAGDLLVEVEHIAGDAAHVTYRFDLRVGEVQVLSGRALVVLDAAGVAT
jgi:predicted hotdog family 3-hydroxylacyl-ACP dehydratase